MSVTSTTDTTSTTEPRRRGRGIGQSLRRAVALPLHWSGAGVRRLGRAVRVLRGWWGLTLGVLVAAAVLLGPAGGARWIAHEATLVRHDASVKATAAYHAAYVAVAWPAANGALWLDALHPAPATVARRSGAATWPCIRRTVCLSPLSPRCPGEPGGSTGRTGATTCSSAAPGAPCAT